MSANKNRPNQEVADGDSQGEGKKGKKGNKGAKGKRSGPSNAGISVATHPRARLAVRRAKGWGGLIGFALAAYAAHGAHLSLTEAGAHALVAGVAGYLLAWACAVAIGRHLVLTELKSIAERLRSAREAAAGATEDAAAKPADAPAGS